MISSFREVALRKIKIKCLHLMSGQLCLRTSCTHFLSIPWTEERERESAAVLCHLLSVALLHNNAMHG